MTTIATAAFALGVGALVQLVQSATGVYLAMLAAVGLGALYYAAPSTCTPMLVPVKGR
jgi:uncharacterized membrane protein